MSRLNYYDEIKLKSQKLFKKPNKYNNITGKGLNFAPFVNMHEKLLKISKKKAIKMAIPIFEMLRECQKNKNLSDDDIKIYIHKYFNKLKEKNTIMGGTLTDIIRYTTNSSNNIQVHPEENQNHLHYNKD